MTDDLSDPARSLDAFAAAKLAALAAHGRRRQLAETDRGDPVRVRRGGRALISFSCNDYLNLSGDERVKEAAREAISRFGAGAGASRLVTGNHPPLAALEARLARFKGTEAALVFGSGYLANLGIVPALAGEGDLVLADELAHACLQGGAALSRAALHRFRHNDMGHLADLLAAERARHRHCLILTDGVFSMDGDLAPLPEMAALAARHDAWLMVDDAHGLGVVGGGRGARHTFNPPPAVPLQMGTLSKALGSYGGYLCASAAVVDLLRSRARTLVYSTGLPPAAAAAALAALDIIESDQELCARPLARAALFCRLAGLPAPQSPVVPVILGSEADAMAASARLEVEGFLAVAIRPPTVPEGTARLRLAFTAAHSDEDIRRLAGLIRELIDRAQPRQARA